MIGDWVEEIGIECYSRELWRTKRHKDPPFETKGGAPGEGKINAEVAEETQRAQRKADPSLRSG